MSSSVAAAESVTMTPEGLGIFQSKFVRVHGYDIRLREFTTEQYSEVKANSVEIVRGRPKANLASVEANSLYYAIDHSTWPTEAFGPLTVDAIKKLPARITKPLIAAMNELNRLSEEETDFLPSKSQSPEQESRDSSTPSSSQGPVSG